MDFTMIAEYAWMFVILIFLEGILAADNACVLGVMVKHLPVEERKRALMYGLAGAFVFRAASLFAISMLIEWWQLQAIGALYLIFLSLNHVYKSILRNDGSNGKSTVSEGAGFWETVIKVEIADIAFAADSILAAVALAVSLPKTTLPSIGGLDGGHFMVVFAGGFVGLVFMRFAAQWFVNILLRKPGLETAAYLLVGWVGVKLAVYTLSHPGVAWLDAGFSGSLEWKFVFWSGFVLICLGGWFFSKPVKGKE
ncbi:TerC family protein [Pelosinus propionicus]|uniref:Integral membrane protein, YkoY family n=1 Tax=Pelosinus propionicus DSM 13327 TaxID=1123291 RepID=A0A1I4PWC9_9FIRM|nr:TerC family protein [Pelosinus propionicus]SFM31790.1 integral membrane protein, YkoY family [Pelosinus propionicus DSM 13327]